MMKRLQHAAVSDSEVFFQTLNLLKINQWSPLGYHLKLFPKLITDTYPFSFLLGIKGDFITFEEILQFEKEIVKPRKDSSFWPGGLEKHL